MKVSLLRFMLIAALLGFTQAPASAAEGKMPVYISFVGEDALGRKLGAVLRENLKTSGRFEDVAKEDSSSLIIYLTTIDPSAGSDGLQTAYAYVLAITNARGLNALLNSKVGICGSSLVQKCASLLYADVGKTMEEIRGALQGGRETSL
jgi:hypothetical protein